MFLPDAIHHRNANVFYGPQQVFVCNEIPGGGEEETLLQTFFLAPPYSTAVGSSDVLGKMVEKNSVNPEKFNESQ